MICKPFEHMKWGLEVNWFLVGNLNSGFRVGSIGEDFKGLERDV
jgi:hypothetical protein